MDYRSLLAVPIAAAAITASGAETLRQPAGWTAGATFAWPQGATHEAGVAPETEGNAQRALTVKAIGTRQAHEMGSISQYAFGYAGQRVRFSAQVKATGADGWAGLVVGSGFIPLHLQPMAPETGAPAPVGLPACPDWCEVSVVADIPAHGDGVANVGLALVGNGQVWARGFQLETVGREVPATAQPFGTEAARVWRALQERLRRAQAGHPVPLRNLSLQ